MDKSYFLKLLHKYLEDNAKNEEYQFLLSYYNLFESEPDVLALLSEEQKEDLKNQMQTVIWQSIALHEQQDKKVKPMYRRWITAAAVVLIICSAGIIYFFNQSPLQLTSRLYKKTTVARSDQQKEHRLIRLPDGSTVIVSEGSKLNYPSSFDGLAKREVYLEGQAFFDIKHNASKPFIVHTGKLETTVLGTAFNIKAWPDDVNITVTVIRGRVKVGDHTKILSIITSNQQITYNNAEANIIVKTVDNHINLDWKQQDMLFDDVTVGEATELLVERFKVRITCNNELIRSQRFTTTFMKDESLEHVLKSICEFNNAVYTYDKEKATVIINNK